MNVTVVHNEDAGHGSIGRRELTRWIERAGHRPTYSSTDDEDALAAALVDPGDLVVVAGGDGSVRSVGRALIGSGTPMTILPMGTANNVATHLGLVGDIDVLVAQWAGGRLRSFDVGTVTAPWGPNVFLEGCGFGALTRTMAALSLVEAPPAEDGTPDHELARDLEVTRELLADHPLHAVDVVVDGVELSGRFIAVEVMNIRSLGANIALAPGADASDGLLDVVLIEERHRRELRDYLTARLASLRGEAQGEPFALDIPVRRAGHVVVRWSGSRIHVDDQIAPDEEAASSGRYWADGVCALTIGLLPSALSMLLPGDVRPSRAPSAAGTAAPRS